VAREVSSIADKHTVTLRNNNNNGGGGGGGGGSDSVVNVCVTSRDRRTQLILSAELGAGYPFAVSFFFFFVH
jgi:hypothetical protein